MFDLDETIRLRRSTRMFRPEPAPRHFVEEAAALAMCAPSNSNVQPWRLVLTSGDARDRLVAALVERASVERPNVPQLPDSHAHLRRELGVEVCGAMGIAHDDAEARNVALLRNWEFFGAPMGGVVCMHRDPGLVDSMGAGMFLQTLMLALTARGLATCVQVSIAAYPEIIREQLQIPEESIILCGLAIGYADPDFAANRLRIGRNALDTHVKFME
jgi:nitroreductase